MQIQLMFTERRTTVYLLDTQPFYRTTWRITVENSSAV